MQPTRNTFDATYATRYPERNAEKVQRILDRLDAPSTLLDLGCNAGYVDAAVLDKFPAAQCHGVELDKTVVDQELLANPRFRLTVSDVVEFQFDQVYGAVIFNAVLHHVLGKYGKEAAFRLWTRIIDHTAHELFFETGIVAEAGEYYWKDAILREFGGDEAYYSELIRRIGPRLKRMDVVAELPIHKTVRLLHRFELHPPNSEFDFKAAPQLVYEQGYLDDSHYEVIAEFRRTEGSHGQRLIDVSELAEQQKDSVQGQQVFQGTQFFHLREIASGSMFFAKRIADDPLKQMREFRIHAQVQHPRLVPCVGVSQEYGLVFPLVEGTALTAIDWAQIENRDEVAGEIEEFFEQAAEMKFKPGKLDIDPLSTETSRFLIDTTDLHANNFLVRTSGARVVDWKVVDLEHYANENRSRNERHLREIMELLKTQRKSWVARLLPGRRG